MEQKKLRDVITRRIEPGICPKCGDTMSLLIAQYKACKISPRGWIQAVLDKQSKYICVCQNCGYTQDMKITVRGLLPYDFDEEYDTRPKLLSSDENPISDNKGE